MLSCMHTIKLACSRSEVIVHALQPPRRRIARKLWRAGFYALSWVDYIGEAFAYQLGITSPKYQYVIDELISLQEEMDAEVRLTERVL